MKSASTLCVWGVLCLALLGAIGGFVGTLEICADDGCPPTCGDCLACGQLAWIPVPVVVTPVLPVPTGISDLEPSRPQPPPRPVDHVPLLRA